MEKSGEFSGSLKSTDWAWISGYLDVEGCFMIQRNKSINKNYKKTKRGKPYWYFYLPRLFVCSGDFEALTFISKAFDCNVRTRKLTETNHKPLYDIEVGSLSKLNVILGNILPYLRAKYAQAECLYRFCQIPRPCGPNRSQIHTMRENLFQEFRDIAERTGQAFAGRPFDDRSKLIVRTRIGR